MSENDDPAGRRDETRRATTRCANAPCPRPVEPGDAYCDSCGLERSLFTRRGGDADSGGFEQPRR
jgi:hypothetical protein